MPRGDEHADEKRGSALLEVALPMVALAFVGTVAMLVVGDVEDRARSMGWWFFAISGGAIAGLAGTCTLLWLQRRGRNVPVALLLFVATLPWLTGLGGMRFGMHRADQVIELAAWSPRALMALRGFAEASASAAYGQHLSAALLCAIAIVLAVRADRADRSRAFVGLVVASVVVAFVGPALAIAHEGTATMMLIPLGASLVAFGGVAGRSGAPGVAVAGFLATLATCSAATLDAAFPRLLAIASSSSEHQRALFEDIVLSHGVLEQSDWIAIGAVGLGALLVIGESFRRVDRAQIGRASALTVVALTVLSFHWVGSMSSMRAVETWTRPAWQHVEGFVLARTSHDQWPDEPRLVMSVDGAIWLDDEPITPADSTTLRDALEEAERRHEELDHERWLVEEEETPEWLLDAEEEGVVHRSKAPPLGEEPSHNRYAIGIPPDDDAREAAREAARRAAREVQRYWPRPAGIIEGCALGGRPVDAVVDARAPLHRLFTLLGAGGELGLLGRGPQSHPIEPLRRLRAIANVAERRTLRSIVSLGTPLRECDALPGNDVLLTAVLGTEPVEMLHDYETGADMVIPSSLERRANDQPIIVFVRPEEDATVQHLADFAWSLRVADRVRLVLVRELPELPPATPLPTEISDAARDAHVSLGNAYPEELRPVYEAGRAGLEQCARRMLTVNPGLDTGMRTSVRIDTDGRVQIVRTLSEVTGLRSMRACIADVVRTWSFPPSEQDTILTFGLTLGTPFYEG